MKLKQHYEMKSKQSCAGYIYQIPLVYFGKVGPKSKFHSHLEVAREPGKGIRGLLSNFKMATELTYRTYFSKINQWYAWKQLQVGNA